MWVHLPSIFSTAWTHLTLGAAVGRSCCSLQSPNVIDSGETSIILSGRLRISTLMCGREWGRSRSEQKRWQMNFWCCESKCRPNGKLFKTSSEKMTTYNRFATTTLVCIGAASPRSLVSSLLPASLGPTCEKAVQLADIQVVKLTLEILSLECLVSGRLVSSERGSEGLVLEMSVPSQTVSDHLVSRRSVPLERLLEGPALERSVPSQVVSNGLVLVKARNDEWVGARPDVSSTVLLWTQDIAHPKGIATEKRFLYKRGDLWTGLWPWGSSSTLEGRGSSGMRCRYHNLVRH